MFAAHTLLSSLSVKEEREYIIICLEHVFER